jgi:hypothetical protein
MSLTKVSYAMIDGASVNVKDFGAKGDGVTDDTAAIQAAIDYCLSFENPKVKGQSLIPTLVISGLCYITSTLNIDRVEGQTSQFKIVSDGFVGGFVVTTAITIFSTTFAGSNAANPSLSVLSNGITFEGLTFQGQAGAIAYAIDLPKYVRTRVNNCFFNSISMCTDLVGYIQTAYIDNCFTRFAPAIFIRTVDAYDVSITNSWWEACASTVFYAGGAIYKGAFINNLAQGLAGDGHFLDCTSANAVDVCDNYIEFNTGSFIRVTTTDGMTVAGNYINTRQNDPDNRSNASFYEVDVLGNANSFTGFGNHATHRLYKFATLVKNANIGAGDYAGVSLQNTTQFIVNKSVGAQTTDAFGLIKNYADTSFQYWVYDGVITADLDFCKVSLGTQCGTAIISVVTSGFQPGFDSISHIQRWFVTTSAGGTVTVTLKESQGVTVNSVAATVSGNDIVLSWVYRATLGRDSFLNSSVEVSAVAGGQIGVEYPSVGAP